MRYDLAAAFISAKNANFRRPRQLLVFKFPDAGYVYISDQKMGESDGLSNKYQPLVESWGELQDSAGDATSADSGETRQMSLTLWNGGAQPFSDYFLAEYPENVEVELYQWFAGQPESSKALIDRFVVQDPIEFDESSRLLRLDLVSLSIRYDQPCGELLTRDDWPYAADSDIGKGIPVAFGSPGRMPALKAKTVQTLRLKGSVLTGTMVLQVYENLDGLLFPSSGTVLIDEEKIRYSGRTASSLIVIQRGYLSQAAEHLDKREIVSVINDHTFVLCAGPVAQIANVLIDGYPAPPEIYTVRPDLDPARIIFSEKPWVKKFSEATRFLEMQFDAVAAANSALQPSNAYDAADLATAACIKPGNAVLALLQATVNRNRGEIMRAYLAVEHWSSGNYLSDFAEVWVSGVGVVGRLSRPNPNDEIELDADVDIDHPHSHEIGGEHIHNFTQPAVATNDPEHLHAASSTSPLQGRVITDGGTTGLPAAYYSYSSGYVSFGFSGQSNIISQRIHVRFNPEDAGEVTLRFGDVFSGWQISWQAGVGMVDQWFNVWPPQSAARFSWTGSGIVGSKIFFYEVTLETTLAGTIAAARTGVSAAASGGAVRDSGVVNVKNQDDVQNLATANRGLNINTQNNPSRTVVNLFDLTSQVNFDWNWFTGREIRISYINAGDSKSVYILHAFFDVEFVPTEVVHSDAITAEVTSLYDCHRPDQAIQKLLMTKSGVTATDFDAAAFDGIAYRFWVMGYRLDGLIAAEETVRDAIKRICYQSHSRFFTSGGKLKMVLREGHPASKPVARQLTGDNLQMRSISVSRQPLRDIANRVQLFYKRDWTASDSSTAGFLDSVTRENAASIVRFGLKAKADSYNFDLIRDAAMAARVADFYLMTDAWPSSFYTFMAYLDQFDLEKEDVIAVSANFHHINKMPMVIRSMDRIFGSGKASAINLLRIVAENLFYILTKVSVADAVMIGDTLFAISTDHVRCEEAAHTIDALFARLNTVISDKDMAMVSDTLLMVWAIRKNLFEQITATTAVYANQTSQQHDTVVMEDFPEAWSVYGFGSGAFGQVPFGGLSAWRQKSPDEIYIFEQMLAAISALQTSTVIPSESLLIGSGFGGHMSSGFGLSPFGG